MSFSSSFFFSFFLFLLSLIYIYIKPNKKKKTQILFGSIFPTKKNLCLSFQKHKSFINKISYILFNTHHWHTATSWETMKLHHYANLVVTHVITALWRNVGTPPGSFVSTTVKQKSLLLLFPFSLTFVMQCKQKHHPMYSLCHLPSSRLELANSSDFIKMEINHQFDTFDIKARLWNNFI